MTFHSLDHLLFATFFCSFQRFISVLAQQPPTEEKKNKNIWEFNGKLCVCDVCVMCEFRINFVFEVVFQKKWNKTFFSVLFGYSLGFCVYIIHNIVFIHILVCVAICSLLLCVCDTFVKVNNPKKTHRFNF